MATRPLIQLSCEELATALDGVEPIDVVGAELVAPTRNGLRDVRLSRWSGRISAASVPGIEWAVLEDLRTGPLCVLPAECLTATRTAILAAVAAQTMLAPGPVTVAILGSGPALRPLLLICARQLRGVRRITTYPTRPDRDSHVDSSLLDQMDLAGIQFVVAAVVDEAVVAANLVVALDPLVEHVEIGQLAAGALVVNAAGRDWSADLVGAVDRLCVDDKAPADGLAGRKVDADLGQVLSGAVPGRTTADQVILFELLGCELLDVRLAAQLHQVALDRALGTRLPN